MSDSVTAAIASRARETGALAIDTEFMGEGRYRSLLCLVQVAVTGEDGAQWVEVLDPLVGSVDWSPLAEVLADPQVEIIFHAGRQDVAILRRVWRTEVTNIFDTQIAAGFAGMRAQLGYEALLSELLSVKLSKSASFTRWDARPLSEEQDSYAREDVLHLIAATGELKRRLESLGRLEWAQEECRALEGVSDERTPEAMFERLPRINSHDPGPRAVALALTQWRDSCAAQEDKPIQTVLADAALVEIAKRRPQDLDRLRQIRGLHEGVVRRRGKEIIEQVERGRGLPPIPVDGDRPAPADPRDAGLIVLAEALVRARAAQSGFAYELLAARADLQRVVTAVRLGTEAPDVRTLNGWRRELVGDELLELLAGKRSLYIDDKLDIAVADR